MESARVKQNFSDELVASVAQFAEKCASALRAGGKIIFFGNGGSAADALHLAAELVVRLRQLRRGLAALALTANPAVLTAAGNDYGFEQVFSRQIESLVTAQDVLVALSTSGMSPNIIRGVEAGRARGDGAPILPPLREKLVAHSPVRLICFSTSPRAILSGSRRPTSPSGTLPAPSSSSSQLKGSAGLQPGTFRLWTTDPRLSSATSRAAIPLSRLRTAALLPAALECARRCRQHIM